VALGKQKKELIGWLTEKRTREMIAYRRGRWWRAKSAFPLIGSQMNE